MLFDYETLKIIWWLLVGVVLVLYASTAGFDFGVTLLMPFLKRKAHFTDNDAERRVILNTISATWDGNQTWLVFGGGAIFVIWPVVYAATFSGMYALMMLILWSFFLRPPGFDYRSKLPSETWKKCWDWGLFISAFFPMLAFGLAIGNLFEGLPIHFGEVMMRSYYSGGFLGLINPFGVVCALTCVFMALMHGTAHLNRRTDGDLQCYFRQFHRVFSVLFLVLFTLGGIMLWVYVNGYTLVHSPVNATYHPLANVVTRQVGAWIAGMNAHPWKWLPVILTYVSVIAAMILAAKGCKNKAFWASSAAILGTVFTAGFTLFPFIIPSSFAPAQSITIWNAVSSQYTLMGMFYICLPILVIIFVYKLMSYGVLWRKKTALSVEDINTDSHTYY